MGGRRRPDNPLTDARGVVYKSIVHFRQSIRLQYTSMKDAEIEKVLNALDALKIEIPSWGFADTGTRFGKYLQEAAAIDLNDKLSDAGQVNRYAGNCPLVAVHVQWDFDENTRPADVAKMAGEKGVSIGSINPNLFQDQCYKYGSFGNPDSEVRTRAVNHVVESIELGKAVDSKVVTLWFADGTNYPGQDSIRDRKRRFEECLKLCHEKLSNDQTLLVEYKPFEPAFYHTDIADWGMSYVLSKKAGPRAKVLVDTGHHYLSQNIEQIVAFLLDEEMLGGFHFNDRRYADDDLTLGSIDPYQIFRIFNEILGYSFETGNTPDIAYMIDQSHNLKPKVQAMIQTVVTAQELFAKAALVDREALEKARQATSEIDAEECLRRAFFTDVTPALHAWREKKNLPVNPLTAYRESGYESEAAKERSQRRKDLGLTAGGSYA